jgi:hypothetical protein
MSWSRFLSENYSSFQVSCDAEFKIDLLDSDSQLTNWAGFMVRCAQVTVTINGIFPL